MQLYYDFQSFILLALGLVALGCEVFALVDAVRQPAAAYVAASKRTRTFWLVLLAVALAIGVATVNSPLNLFSLIAFVGAAVYLADVRPALRQVRGIGGGSSRGW